MTTRLALALGLVAALACPGCSPSGSVEILEFEVSPTGRVARCQVVTVRFLASGQARYALTSGATTVAAGLTRGLREEISFTADALGEGAGELRLTLATGSEEAMASVSLGRDDRNAAPTARPRLAGVPAPGGTVGLDASLSDDVDGEPIAGYAWRIVEGPQGARIEDAAAATTSLVLPEGEARVVVELTVTDAAGARDTARLTVRAESGGTNQPPVIEPRDGFWSVETPLGGMVTLEAAASDPEGQPVTIEWRQVAGPPVSLAVAPDGASAEFAAPTDSALLTFEVVASDGVDDTRARVEVMVGEARADAPPAPAIAILDPVVMFAPVRLDGSGTVDPDTEDLQYEWTVRRAPPGSLLGDDVIRGRLGRRASQIEVVFDLPGVYELELRAADALGLSPAAASLEVQAALDAVRVHSSAVIDLACTSQRVAWAGPGGVAVLEPDGIVTILAEPSRAVAVAADGRLWLDATAFAGGAPSIATRYSASAGELEVMALPDGVSQINALGIDPSLVRAGDVYVGTDTGTAILDRSQSGCAEFDGLGCWVGSPSIGYLHQPPSRTGYTTTSVDELHVSLDPDGTTVAHLGNEYWLIRLERGDEDQVFRQIAIDLFSDSQPQQVTALGTTPGGDLYCGVASIGVVRRSVDGECGFSTAAPTVCPRAPLDECTLAPSAAAPSAIAGLAPWGEGIFVAADAFYHHDPALARFARIGVGGDQITGTPAAVAVCGSTLYLGTDQGLWSVALEGEP